MAKEKPKTPITEVDTEQTHDNVENNVELLTLKENIKSLELEKKALTKEVEEEKLAKENLGKDVNELTEKLNSANQVIEQLNEKNEQLNKDNIKIEEKFRNEINNHQNGDKELAKIIEELKNQVQVSEEKEKKTKEELNALRIQLNDFVAQRNNTEENKDNQITLADFPARLLNTLATKLSEKYKRNITPKQIIEDYLLRYNLQRWSQWFHPFVVSDNEILSMAKEVKPEIKNIQELHNALNIH